MTYQETCEYLFNQLPMFEKQKKLLLSTEEQSKKE